MKYLGNLLYIPACWLIFAIVSCMAAPAGQAQKMVLPVDVLRTGSQCLPAPESWTATWISSSVQLRQMISRCNANRIGIVPKEEPAVDFERFGVLAVEMGQQSSAGYGFEAEKITAYLEAHSAIVKLDWRRPSPGALTAQMVTGPWILIRMPVGLYNNIRVVDNDGRLLAQINL